MTLGFTNQVFTLAQMEYVIRKCYREWHEWSDIDKLEMEEIALIICEAANLNLIEVIAALQRLKEWGESQHARDTGA